MDWVTPFLFLSSLCVCSQAQNNGLTVTVDEGTLVGYRDVLLNGIDSYNVFKGIPFATPPVGDLRFKAPLPPKSWNGIRNATEHGSVCPQLDLSNNYVGNEDCLYLNVYTKSVTTKAPVMVFIYGGSFTTGSGNTDLYGPQFLVSHDVVLVTFNYRLKMLGFLSVDTAEVPGNAGLKDQVLALKWVKKNIRKFGGNPHKVTIFGESAGAESVTLLLLSPMARGLFQRAIVQSGNALQDLGIAREAKEKAFRAGRVLGKNTSDTHELLQFLRSVSVEELTRLTLEPLSDDKYRLMPNFVPNIEKKFDNINAIITEEPIDMLLQKKVNPVPLVIGYTSAEGLLVLSNVLNDSEVYNANPKYLVPWEIYQKVSENTLKEYGQRIQNFYTAGQGISRAAAISVQRMLTDLFFGYSTHRFAYLYSKLGVTVYMYRFEYDTALNVFKAAIGWSAMEGACHADDIFYLFYNNLNKAAYDSDERLRNLVSGMAELWTTFARRGNPTHGNNTSPKWRIYTASQKKYFALSEPMSNKKYADRDGTEFIDSLYCGANLPCLTT